MEGRLQTRITADPADLFLQTLALLPEELTTGESLKRVWDILEAAMPQILEAPILADNCRGVTPRIPAVRSFVRPDAVRSNWASSTLAARRLGSLCHVNGSQLMERRYAGVLGRAQLAFEEVVPRENFLTAGGALRSGFIKGLTRVVQDATRLLSAEQDAFYELLIGEAEEYLVRLIGEAALISYKELGASPRQLLTAYASLLQLTLEAEADGFPKGPYALEVSVAPRTADVQPGRIDQLALVEVAGKPPTRRHLLQFAELISSPTGRRSASHLMAACARRLRDPVLQVHDLKFEVGDGSDRTRGEITQRSYRHCLRVHGHQVGVYLDACELSAGTIVYATPSLQSQVRQVPVTPVSLKENLGKVNYNQVFVARATQLLGRRIPKMTPALQQSLFAT